jgi:hypothetical protein
MDRQSKPQLALFPDELPRWDQLSPERQDEVQEILALLLERSLQPSGSTTQSTSSSDREKSHV